MKRFHVLASLGALAMLHAGPALAGWKIAPRGAPAAVLKGAMSVTPAEDWNFNSSHPMKKGETWTLDGASLNELYLVAGLAPGETLFKDVAKKDRPLPKLGAGAVLTDIPEFVESSVRIQLNTSQFETTGVEPVKFGGRDGVKFSYRYSVQGESLTRQGVAMATLAGKNLYLINFTAPSIYYFDRDKAKAEAIMASAKF